MRVLIADDEPVALQRLELALSCIPETEVVGLARDGEEALRLISSLAPDLVLLDIRMPLLDGISAAERVLGLPVVPEIIFVTAYDEYAVRAFALHAADYLLKPASFERIREAVRNARTHLSARDADARFAQLERLIATLRAPGGAIGGEKYVDCLWVPQRGGLTRVPLRCVDLIEAEGDYAAVWCGASRHLIKETMLCLQAVLDPNEFLRVHRSAIVNLSRVQAIRRRGSRGHYLVLPNERRVDVGHSYGKSLLERLRPRQVQPRTS